MKVSHRVRVGVLLTTVLTVVGAASASGQDVVKVSPETHRVLLENDRVRVLDVQLKPGEQVAMHSHPAGILYYLSDATLKITYRDGKSETRNVKAGTAVWSKAVTHAAENVGPTTLNEVQTELKAAVKRPARAK